jgi:hypothetical protein
MASSMKLQMCMRCWKPLVGRINNATTKQFTLTDNVSRYQSTVSCVADSALNGGHEVSAASPVYRRVSSVPCRRAVVSASCGAHISHRNTAAVSLLSVRNDINGCARLMDLLSANGRVMQHTRNLQQVRAFSTAGSGSSGSDDGWPSSSSNENSDGSSGDEGAGVPVGGESDLTPPLVALSPMTVPEVWPRVPVIAVRRHPLFPRFIKMIEVSFVVMKNYLQSADLFDIAFEPCCVITCEMALKLT